MKNRIKVSLVQLFAIVTLAAFVGSATGCSNPGGGAKPGKTDMVVLDIRNVTGQGWENWDYLVTGEGRPPMVFSVNESTGLPDRLYLKQDKNDVDVTMFFNASGQPDIMVANGYSMYFFNYDEYRFDTATVFPNGEIEYNYGIETDTNWSALASSTGRSAFSDEVGWWLEVADKGIAVGTCVAAIFFTPMLVGCVISTASLVAEATVAVLDATGVIGEGTATIGGLSIDAANLVIDGIGCAKIAADLIGGAVDCASFFIGGSKIALDTCDELGVFDEDKKEEIVQPVSVTYWSVNFHPNGGLGPVPAPITVANNGSVTLPSAADLYRTGYTFKGWSAANSGDSSLIYSAGSQYPYPITRNTSFYAKWGNLHTDAPAWVTATAQSANSIRVSWAPVDGALYYTVYRGDCDYSGGLPRNIKHVGTVNAGSSPSYTDTGLSENKWYYYAVSAWNIYGESNPGRAYGKTGSATNPGDTPTGIEMVWIQPGTFTMGSPSSEPDRLYVEAQHQVTLTRGFYMGKYEVTQDQYMAVMGTNPSHCTSTNYGPVAGDTQGRRPVESVSWYNALVFCNKLSMAEGLSPVYRINNSTNPADWGSVPTSDGNTTWDSVQMSNTATGYRLPTEAEWEYACRAGTTTAYNTGATFSDNTGWYYDNSDGRTHEVGKKPANAWGLYDMHGNVWEWCWDWYKNDYLNEPQTDPLGASSGSDRVCRGGGWDSGDATLRSARRYPGAPSGGGPSSGFRVVRNNN